MNLTQTVSEILKKDVTVEEAKDFANNQFGVLATYLRSKNENGKIVRLPLGYELKEPKFRINQYYRLVSELNEKAILYQVLHDYYIVVDKKIVVKVM